MNRYEEMSIHVDNEDAIQKYDSREEYIFEKSYINTLEFYKREINELQLAIRRGDIPAAIWLIQQAVSPSRIELIISASRNSIFAMRNIMATSHMTKSRLRPETIVDIIIPFFVGKNTGRLEKEGIYFEDVTYMIRRATLEAISEGETFEQAAFTITEAMREMKDVLSDSHASEGARGILKEFIEVVKNQEAESYLMANIMLLRDNWKREEYLISKLILSRSRDENDRKFNIKTLVYGQRDKTEGNSLHASLWMMNESPGGTLKRRTIEEIMHRNVGRSNG